MPTNKPVTSTNATVSATKVRRIRRMLNTGRSNSDIARRIGCSRHVVYRVKSYRNFNWVA